MRAAAVAESAEALPAIQTWWPYLTSGARHALMARPYGEFQPRVRDEIERATGLPLYGRTHLSEDDRVFLAQQDEEVGHR